MATCGPTNVLAQIDKIVLLSLRLLASLDDDMMANRSAPFSTHSRGVPLFNRSRFFDVPRHIARLLLDLRDISSSAFWFLTCQTWLTFWAALITLCSGEQSFVPAPWKLARC